MDAPPVGRLFGHEQCRVADVRTGEALKASKRETHPKMKPPEAQASKAAGRPPVGEAARAQQRSAAAKPGSRPTAPPPPSSGLGHHPFRVELAGSNPAGGPDSSSIELLARRRRRGDEKLLDVQFLA